MQGRKEIKWKYLSNDEIPKLNIVIMIAGTHGDVLPFIGFAHALQDLGHRIRLATHECHREAVVSRGIEYYELAGDPKELSEFMVQTGGSIIGAAKRLDLVPANTAMVCKIIRSTWPACTDPGPIANNPFIADIIVSNPPTMGHVHVAEALGIPLHIMFPQPWFYPTGEFPHPMVGLSYEDKDSHNQKLNNIRSYTGWELLQFQSFEKVINKWRAKTLKIPRIHGHMMMRTIPDACIPFSAMWSPSFVPKPNDWPEQCRVVGTFNFKERHDAEKDGDDDEEAQQATKKISYDPIAAGFGDLVDWFNNGGPKPVFIGFGSMVIKEPEKLVEIITEAAKKVGCRIVVQSGWTQLDVSNCANAEDLPADLNVEFTGPLCHNVGRCPHDWLLPLCCAVVHHGGAGTTAAGLKHGLPTLVCPFFADQFMWSEMVARADVGPKPCPVKDLTVDILAERLAELTSANLKANAVALSHKMNAENGIKGGVKHFFDSLPIDNMFCDVKMLLGEVAKAHYRIIGPKIKVSIEVAAATELTKLSEDQIGFAFGDREARLEPMDVFDYNVAGHITSVSHGCLHGCVGFFFNFFQAMTSCYNVPNTWAYKGGMCGCVFGTLWFPFKMVATFFYAVLYYLDAVLVGIFNSNEQNHYKWLINPWANKKSNVHLLPYINSALTKYVEDGINEERFSLLLTATEAIKVARTAFNKCRTEYSPILRCDEVVVNELLLKLDSAKTRRLFVNQNEREKAKQHIIESGLKKITFSRLCHILYLSVGQRILRRKRIRNRESVRHLLKQGNMDDSRDGSLNNDDQFSVRLLENKTVGWRIQKSTLAESRKSRMMVRGLSKRSKRGGF